MCGLVGIYGSDFVAQDVYDALVTLQHRGQDAAGIVTYNGRFHVRKDFGLVQDVFHTRHMRRLQGYVGIGHTRYATIGTGDTDELQPFTGPSPFGVTLAHNGNLFNSHELHEEIFTKDHRLVNSESDGEVLLNIFTKALSQQDPDSVLPEHVYKAVERIYERAQGAYSVVAYIAGQGMVAFRDPYGIRPLQMGRRLSATGIEYMFASESVPFDVLGFETLGDVGAGEVIFIDEATRSVHRQRLVKKTPTPCAFEYVYFARPDSTLDGVSVHQARLLMGTALGKRIAKEKLAIDIVVPVPDSARTAAFAVADTLDLPYREGLIKNRYIGRTFIMPGQAARKKSIRYKLNAIKQEFVGKRVLLVDDSIVRGNTSKKIIELVREAGATEVYFASYAPPIKYPNVYGIDIPTKEELIAAQLSVEDVAKVIGADRLFYGEIEDMKKACAGSVAGADLDMSCFDGEYKTGDVSEAVLQTQARSRNKERLAAVAQANLAAPMV